MGLQIKSVRFYANYSKKVATLLSALTLVFGVSFPALASAAPAPSYHTFGDASISSDGVTGNAAQLGNNGTNGYGGVDFTDTGVTTLSDLNNLSTDCNFIEGQYGAGTPRFGADLENADGTDGGSIFFYLNNTDCPQNSWGNTGNLASPTSTVDTSQLSGGSFSDNYANAQNKYGSYNVTDLFIVSDQSYSSQTLLIDNTKVNDYTYDYGQPTPVAPTNKDECKNGGYMNFQTTYKNQGQCIASVVSNSNSKFNR
jgi:hypothetical protein